MRAQPVRTLRLRAGAALLALALVLLRSPTVAADCPGNLLSNAGFEGDWYAGSTVGTGISSFISDDWLPWAVLGDTTHEEAGYNSEPEYKILQRSVLADGWYRVYAGERAQAFFSMYSTHTAGFYQRVAVPEGSELVFTIWVQIYTGQEDLSVDGRYPVSDLVQPLSEPTRSVKGPGDYRVYAGIDPFGNTPTQFGASLPLDIVWSDPVLDVQTRSTDSAGNPVDEWVQLSVRTQAQDGYVTVYAKGQPTYRTKHNDSYWDDACLQVVGQVVPTATPATSATLAMTSTARPAASPEPTLTPIPPSTVTHTPRPALTPLPSKSPVVEAPSATVSPTATVRVVPTLRTATATTTAATAVADTSASASVEPGHSRPRVGLMLLYAVNLAAVWIVVRWLRDGRRR